MPADINEEMTPEARALGREAKRIIESDAMQQLFATLKASYIRAWEQSHLNEKGEPRPLEDATAYRGTMWVKVKCLEDLQYEMKSYADRVEFAEKSEDS